MPETEMNANLELEAVSLTQRDYALLLTFLRHQVVTGAAADDDFAVALGSLIAEDMTGESWTYGPETGKWFMVSRDPWEEGEPRGPLLVAMPQGTAGLLKEITGDLRRIESEVRRDLFGDRDTDGQSTGPATAFCTRCGRSLEPGLSFCPGCGQQVEAAAKTGPACPGCGKEIKAGLVYCVFCGTRLGGDEHDG